MYCNKLWICSFFPAKVSLLLALLVRSVTQTNWIGLRYTSQIYCSCCCLSRDRCINIYLSIYLVSYFSLVALSFVSSHNVGRPDTRTSKVVEIIDWQSRLFSLVLRGHVLISLCLGQVKRVKHLKRRLESWRECLVILLSLLLWEQTWFPVLLMAVVSSIFTLVSPVTRLISTLIQLKLESCLHSMHSIL